MMDPRGQSKSLTLTPVFKSLTLTPVFKFPNTQTSIFLHDCLADFEAERATECDNENCTP